ncbi:asparagine synthetase B family protein [Parachitinimonas caeni]|uniref:asparagine synthase (glutamine-hydrolyzing) n=1 Tax=Parachitinimonas caeni TaxID=3031301 RepID=A0ABT7DRM2_9NEIS|nr:asparagine synthetase B family protein [Parachitinimonas caeni]MDK2122717.1 asparagine synthase-related protein [Parachitinimonas caeni]
MNPLPTLYGLIGKTRHGIARIRDGLATLLPATFPAAADHRWHQMPEGVALWSPQAAVEGRSVLTWVGGLYASQTGPAPDLLPTLQRRGSAGLRDLAGEFALAHWDGDSGQLLLARDPLGQRHLFIREETDCYLICSALEPLLADPAFACELDYESAFNYLSFGMPLAGRTLARQISRLPAGHCLSGRPGQPLLSQRYFSPLSHDQQKVVDAPYQQQLIATLDDAITRRVVEGRQALLLSGGVDSSYIAGTVARRFGGERFDAYTIEFTDPGTHNEVDFAALVAKEAGIRHQPVPLGVADALKGLERVLQAAEPCSAWAAITHWHILGEIGSQSHQHLLSGLGADEVFGGYSRYLRHYRLLRLFDADWPHAAQIDAADAVLWNPQLTRSKHFPGVPRFFDDIALRQGLAEPYRGWNFAPLLATFYRECRQIKPEAHLFELMVAHECQHRIPDLLFTDFEPIGRELGIRTAYPFLDPAVVQQACALGASERFFVENGRWRNKKALREMAVGRVPEAVLRRSPMSYNAPFVIWMTDPAFGARVRSLLHESGLAHSGLVSTAWRNKIDQTVRSLASRRLPGQQKFAEQMWAFITLAGWYERWVERKLPASFGGAAPTAAHAEAGLVKV